MEHPDRAVAEYRRVVRPGGHALITEANRYNPLFYPHMTLALGHQHFTRRRFRGLVAGVFPDARFGAFEAHYVPGLNGPAQHAVEEAVERLPPRRPLKPPLSYAVDPFVPLSQPFVDVWFGFNPLAAARGLASRRLGRARRAVLWSVDFTPDRFGRGLTTRLYDRLDRYCCLHADA